MLSCVENGFWCARLCEHNLGQMIFDEGVCVVKKKMRFLVWCDVSLWRDGFWCLCCVELKRVFLKNGIGIGDFIEGNAWVPLSPRIALWPKEEYVGF